MMFSEITGNWFYLDGEYLPYRKFNPEFLWNGKSYYEVLRIIKGNPLFLSDHIERFNNTLSNIESQILLDKINFDEIITKLASINNIETGNIKIVVNILKKTSIYIYFIPYRYPSKNDYEQGIKIITCKYERYQPAIKVVNRILREKTETMIQDLQIYEVLLIDNNGNITEGSKSNIFLIKDNQLFTPPLKLVLPGITRKYVLQICKQHNIILCEQNIPFNTITTYDAAFITGTSPKILPVKQINNFKFLTDHPISKVIMTEYENIISKNINS